MQPDLHMLLSWVLACFRLAALLWLGLLAVAGLAWAFRGIMALRPNGRPAASVGVNPKLIQRDAARRHKRLRPWVRTQPSDH